MALELPGSLLGEPLAMLKHLFGFVLNTGGGFNVFIFGAIDRLLTIRRKDGYYRCIDTCLHVYIICILYIYISCFVPEKTSHRHVLLEVTRSMVSNELSV